MFRYAHSPGGRLDAISDEIARILGGGHLRRMLKLFLNLKFNTL